MNIVTRFHLKKNASLQEYVNWALKKRKEVSEKWQRN